MFKVYLNNVEVVQGMESMEEATNYVESRVRYEGFDNESFAIYQEVDGVQEDCIEEDFDYDEEDFEEDYDDDYDDEDDYNSEDEEDMEDYKPLDTLAGVAVKDTDNGFEILLINTNQELLNTYEIIADIVGLDIMKLFHTCNEISNNVKDLYYEKRDLPTLEEVKEIVRKAMVK